MAKAFGQARCPSAERIGPRLRVAGTGFAAVLILSLHAILGAAPVDHAVAQGAAATQPSVARPEGGGGWSAEVKPRPAKEARARSTAIKLSGDDRRTTVRMEVSRQIAANIFTLDEPYRAIVDVPDLDFNLPATAGTRGAGLVTAFRYGQFEAGRSRVVIDLAGPTRVENAMFAPPSGGEPGTLSFDLVRITPQEAAAAASAPAAAQQQLRGARHEEATPAPKSKGKTRHRRTIVIDPGHGGIDPGTVASPTLTEKVVTLAVALQLRSILLQGRRYDVILTRQSDAFVSLDQRVRIARQHAADLFISIHADALAEKGLAQTIRGATVYVLSDRASDEAARRFAEKENAADILAGLAAVPASAEDQVRNILLDLVQRETADFSASFRSMLLAKMQGRVPLAKEPQRSAAFKVLKQPETPAVLIELGYMSNTEDLARLGKPDGQRQLAATIATAVDTFFAQRDAKLGR